MRAVFTAILSISLFSPASASLAGSELPVQGLAHALQSAVSRHPSVLSKLGELGSLAYQVQESEAARYPSFSAQAQSSANASSGALVRITQPVWAFGRIDKGIGLARQRMEVGRLELLELQRKLMEDTAAAYNQVLLQRDRLRAAELNQKEHVDLVALIARRSEGGMASQADIRLANLRLSQARLVVRQIQASLERAQQELQSYSQSSVTGLQPIDTTGLPVFGKHVLEQMLEEGHAPLRVRRQRVQVASDEVTLRELELLPTVSARVDRNFPRSGGNATASSGVALVLEGRLDGAGLVGTTRVRAQVQRLEAARQDVDAVRVEARQRLANLLTESALQSDSVESQAAVVATTRETMDSVLRQFDAGRKSWLDLLNTQRELADARQQLELARGSSRELVLRMAIMLGQLDEWAGLTP
jgi:outer membrane protein, adhesin transport system